MGPVGSNSRQGPMGVRIGLLNSNLDLAGADGISETLAIGDLAGGPMDRWPVGVWLLGPWVWVDFRPTFGLLFADFGLTFA